MAEESRNVQFLSNAATARQPADSQNLEVVMLRAIVMQY